MWHAVTTSCRDITQNLPEYQLYAYKDHLYSIFRTYYSVWYVIATQQIFIKSVQTYIRVITFSGRKVARLSTRPKLNYLSRPRSKITFPLLVQWEEPINIFCMMKRIIKIIMDTIY